MNDIAIRVENLSKRYRIGLKEQRQDTLIGTLTSMARNPLKNLQRLHRMTSFSDNGQASDDVIWALKDVSFEVDRGEVMGIMGRNGAGKSTLLKILSRVTYPTSGRVEIKGKISSLLEVGTGFHPELTGRENIYLNGTILGMTKAEIDNKLEEIVAFSEVEKFIDTPVKYYSSGMRVRLAFSVAAHLEPEILLIDEVLSVGDVGFQKKCLGKMGQVAKCGRTVLFVSHNMASIKSLCETGLYLEKGKIIKQGEVNRAIDAYSASFLENPLELSQKLPVWNSEYGICISNINVYFREHRDDCDLIIEIDIESQRGTNYIGVGFSIRSIDGTKVSVIAPSVTNYVIEKIEGKGRCVFECEDISKYVAGGDYMLDIWLAKQRIAKIIDLKSIVQFNIPSKDIFRSGNYFEQKKYGIVPLPASFSFEEVI